MDDIPTCRSMSNDQSILILYTRNRHVLTPSRFSATSVVYPQVKLYFMSSDTHPAYEVSVATVAFVFRKSV